MGAGQGLQSGAAGLPLRAGNSKVNSSRRASVHKELLRGQVEVEGAVLFLPCCSPAVAGPTRAVGYKPITELRAGRRTIHTVAKISNKECTKPSRFRHILPFPSFHSG